MKTITPFLVCLLVFSMVTAVEAFQIVDSTPKQLVLHSDGSFDMIPEGSVVEGSLEAGDEITEEGYIIVMRDDGVQIVVPSSEINNLEYYDLKSTTKFTSLSACNSGCESSLKSTCNMLYGQYITLTNIQCSSAFLCTGRCDQKIGGCTIDSQCGKPSYCANGCMGYRSGTTFIESGSKCVSGTCKTIICGSYTECGGEACTADFAEQYCVDHASTGQAATSAGCSSTGQPICKYGAVGGGITCTSKSQCVALAPFCQYGRVGEPYCNQEKNCQGDVYRSLCNWGACNKAPTTPTTPTTPTIPTTPCDGDGWCDVGETARLCDDCTASGNTGCGDGVCSGTEDSVNCGVDCTGSCPPSQSAPSCYGKDVVVEVTSASCSKYQDVLIACPIACEGGVCVDTAPTTGSCGDGTCGSNEDGLTCPGDCPKATCGNSKCDIGEDGLTCPGDCETPTGGGGGIPVDSNLVIIIAVIALLASLGFILMRSRR